MQHRGSMAARSGDRPNRLRACYAMSGTDIAHDHICLRVGYAMPGTETAHGPILLCGMCGTDLPYRTLFLDGIRRTVIPYGTLFRDTEFAALRERGQCEALVGTSSSNLFRLAFQLSFAH
eukprot:2797295-Rhodomonas_salina.1